MSADSYSRKYEKSRHPENEYNDQQQTLQQQVESQKSGSERAKDWASDNRYSLVFGSWVLSMGTALGLVGRNPYLSGAQKLVQARVYAQGLTVAIVIASLALEAKDRQKGSGRWETVKILDPKDPTHKHMIEQKIHHERYTGEDQWMGKAFFSVRDCLLLTRPHRHGCCGRGPHQGARRRCQEAGGGRCEEGKEGPPQGPRARQGAKGRGRACAVKYGGGTGGPFRSYEDACI